MSKIDLMRKASYFSVLLIMSGCVSLDITSNYELSQQQSKGLLVVSITQSGPARCLRYSIHKVGAANTGGLNESFIMSCAPHSKPDWTEKEYGYTGRLSVTELEAGNYEFFKFSEAGCVECIKSKEGFSAVFTIKPGVATYVGNLHITISPDRSKFAVKIQDQKDRDLGLFKGRYTKITENEISVRTLILNE